MANRQLAHGRDARDVDGRRGDEWRRRSRALEETAGQLRDMLKGVLAAGGELIMPPMDVMEQGRMAMARDPVDFFVIDN